MSKLSNISIAVSLSISVHSNVWPMGKRRSAGAHNMTFPAAFRRKPHGNIIAVGSGWTMEAGFVATSVLFSAKRLFWLAATSFTVIGEVKQTPKPQFINLFICCARSSGSFNPDRRPILHQSNKKITFIIMCFVCLIWHLLWSLADTWWVLYPVRYRR